MEFIIRPEETITKNRPLVLYHCGHEQCLPSHSFGPAIRPHYLIHYIRHGKGSYTVNDKTYLLKAGEGFLIYPGETTIYTADTQDPWEYCWIGFDGYDVRAILQSCGLTPSNHIFADQSNGLLWNDFLSLIRLSIERKGNELTLLSQLYLCFSHMFIHSPNSSKILNKALIEKALNYIHNNYTYHIKITDIANYLHIDRTYLYKLFMSLIGTSPQQYLINYRISVSQKMLIETNLSVTEISYSCGFRDTSAFNKHFKKLMHTTPLLYKKHNQHPKNG
ncbi:AraC family transcriptional regulator [Mobilitalea sibirica]|uniref:AraC family transcriptional regulator n=1 Tax=Mobilitalea sibirica TaxID=1462919 RepID=A0A8J7KRR7_9FIRM|nr:AraC family transcriptional regulator [Mobilitalea sibirica]MBH1939561.1 AraC family transcriptional regulator [Mobilitalea sibirica]